MWPVRSSRLYIFSMSNRGLLFKYLKISSAIIVVTALAPLLLAKLGFWGVSFATPTFQKGHEQISYSANPSSYAEAIARATPAVVSVHSTKDLPKDLNPMLRDPIFRRYFGDLQGQIPQEMQRGIGSGVIVTSDGYILTNNHVVNDADEITVKLADGRSAKAKVVGSDPETDLAILKIKLNKLPVIGMANSEKTRVGDVVFAIGNPFGVGQTVTSGIISATHRNDLGINTFENFIQTDAPINPGNSGGALIDVNGNLVGINNAIYTRTGGFQGIGFAVPVNLAKEVMSELIDQGHVTRGWLGITLVSKLTDEVRKALHYPKGEGAVIAAVIRGGPAYVAGLRAGDVIVSVNGQSINNSSDALSVTAKLKPESAYPITAIRDGETLDFRVMIGKRPVKVATQESAAAPAR